LTSVSETFDLARTRSVSSVRVSMMVTFEPLSDLAALRQRLLDERARLAAGRDVVRADVAGALAVRRVRVLREDERLLRQVVDEAGLVVRIDGAHGDAVDALGEQVVHDALLLGGRPVGRNLELGRHVRQLRVGLLDALARDRPEVRGVVGDEGEPLGAAGGGAAIGRVGAAARPAPTLAGGQQKGDAQEQHLLQFHLASPHHPKFMTA
jgi:hypothetical protein